MADGPYPARHGEAVTQFFADRHGSRRAQAVIEESHVVAEALGVPEEILQAL